MIDMYQNISEYDWVIINVQHAGFYRVNYDTKNWDSLIMQLYTNHTLIESVNRAVLLDDSFNLGRAEIIHQTTFLNISRYLLNEEDPFPFFAAFDGLDYIHTMLLNDIKASNMFKVIF